MSIAKYSCVLSSCDKTEWIEKICSWNSSFRNSSSCYGYVEIRLGKNVVIHKFLPHKSNGGECNRLITNKKQNI